jgi:hypothetical protein
MAQVAPWWTVRLACQYRRVGSCAPLPPPRRRRVGGTAMAQVAPWWTVRLACQYRRVGSCAPLPPPRRRRVGGTAMAQVAPWWTVRLACQYRRVGSCAPLPPSAPARRGYGYGSGSAVVDGTTGVPVQACRFLRAAPGACAHGTADRAAVRPCPARPARALFPENRSRRLSARQSAVKTAEGACERSEVLTARQCRALQSRAVFRRNAP